MPALRGGETGETARAPRRSLSDLLAGNAGPRPTVQVTAPALACGSAAASTSVSSALSVATQGSTARGERGLSSVQLPDPPAKLRAKKITASRLAEVLGQILQRQEDAAAGGRPEPRRGPADSTLRAWLRADGAPSKPLRAYAGLPDAQEGCARLAQLWDKIGHKEAAKSMRNEMQTAAQGPTRWDAHGIANALQLMVANPARAWTSLAIDLHTSTKTLTTDINRDGSLRRPEYVASLPGYNSHVESIRTALRSLGHAAQADALPEPKRLLVSGLLNEGHEHAQPLIAAARLLRADGQMTTAAAARAANVPLSLLEMLLDDRGGVRTRADIAPQLSGLNPAVNLRLDRWLEDLEAKIQEAGAVAPGEALLKALHLGRRRMGPDRVLVVDAKTVDPGATMRRRLATIYAQNPELVHPPRSFDTDRMRQPLRWLSTLLEQQFEAGTEIQCYYEPQRRNVIVSSNVSRINDQLASFLKDGGLQPFLAEPHEPAAAATQRQDRHAQKLATRMDPASDPHPDTPAEDILAAIAENRFAVPTLKYRSKGTTVELHAERRIADYLAQEELDPLDTKRLAGTMRPCGVCADEIGAGPEVHRGPFWLSKAASYGVDVEGLIARNIRDGAATSVSRNRDGRVTFDHDTDSDSDVDGTVTHRDSGVLGKRKAVAAPMDEPGPSSFRHEAAVGDVAPAPQHAAPHDDNVLDELSRHLHAATWPSSPQVPSWAPASDSEDTPPQRR